LNFRDRKDLFGDERNQGQLCLSYLKGAALDCFEPALLDPIDPAWLSEFDLFIEELETNFGSFDPEGEAEAELEQTSNARKSSSYEVFHQVPAASRTRQVGRWQHSVDRLTTVWRTYQRTIWFTTTSRTPSKELRVLAQLINSRYWERRAEFPAKTALPDLPETNPNTNLTHQVRL